MWWTSFILNSLPLSAAPGQWMTREFQDHGLRMSRQTHTQRLSLWQKRAHQQLFLTNQQQEPHASLSGSSSSPETANITPNVYHLHKSVGNETAYTNTRKLSWEKHNTTRINLREIRREKIKIKESKMQPPKWRKHISSACMLRISAISQDYCTNW